MTLSQLVKVWADREVNSYCDCHERHSRGVPIQSREPPNGSCLRVQKRSNFASTAAQLRDGHRANQSDGIGWRRPRARYPTQNQLSDAPRSELLDECRIPP
jgi:hypothetical protein